MKEGQRRTEVFEYKDSEGVGWYGVRDAVAVFGVKVSWGIQMSRAHAELFSEAANKEDGA